MNIKPRRYDTACRLGGLGFGLGFGYGFEFECWSASRLRRARPMPVRKEVHAHGDAFWVGRVRVMGLELGSG